MRVYLDTCCFGRPFDDQTQDRVRLETEAMVVVLAWLARGVLELAGSDVVDYEAAAIPDPERRRKVQALVEACASRVSLSDELHWRGNALKLLGFDAYDALHIACAEAAGAGLLVTTDDRFLKRARRVQHELKVRVADPLTLVKEQFDR